MPTNPVPALTRDAKIREIAREVLGIEIESRYFRLEVRSWEIQAALNAAFAAGADWAEKQRKAGES